MASVEIPARWLHVFLGKFLVPQSLACIRQVVKRGTFIYPNFDNDEVFPSLRLEYFREGIEDCAILKQLEAPVGAGNDGKTKAILESIRSKIRIAEKYADAQDPRTYRTLLAAIRLVNCPVDGQCIPGVFSKIAGVPRIKRKCFEQTKSQSVLYQ